MATKTDRLPLIVVDRNYYRRNIIIECCNEHGLHCTDEQARQLLTVVTFPHDPNDRESLWASLRAFLVIDPKFATDDVAEQQLLDLAERWEAANKHDRDQIERLMLNASEGLTGHPSGFDFPCLCDECKSNG